MAGIEDHPIDYVRSKGQLSDLFTLREVAAIGNRRGLARTTEALLSRTWVIIETVFDDITAPREALVIAEACARVAGIDSALIRVDTVGVDRAASRDLRRYACIADTDLRSAHITVIAVRVDGAAPAPDICKHTDIVGSAGIRGTWVTIVAVTGDETTPSRRLTVQTLIREAEIESTVVVVITVRIGRAAIGQRLEGAGAIGVTAPNSTWVVIFAFRVDRTARGVSERTDAFVGSTFIYRARVGIIAIRVHSTAALPWVTRQARIREA